jgi:hypothetical protein
MKKSLGNAWLAVHEVFPLFVLLKRQISSELVSCMAAELGRDSIANGQAASFAMSDRSVEARDAKIPGQFPPL